MKFVLPILILLTACGGCRPELSVVDGVSVRKAEYQGYGQSGVERLWGYTLSELAGRSVDADGSKNRVISFLKSSQRYDVVITGDKKHYQELWRATLERTFGVRATRDTREIDVLVLVAIHGRAVTLEPATFDKPDVKSWPVVFCRHGLAALFPPPKRRATHTFNAFTMDVLAAWLEGGRGNVILNETGLPGAYDFELIDDPHSGETVESSLAALGLELQPARRAVRAIYVEPTGRPVPHPVARADHYQKTSPSWWSVARQSRESD